MVAMATLVGTAIGAGIFGLPYVFSKAGFFPAVMMTFLLGVLMLICNLMYGEIMLRTNNHCRLVGCADRYLGKHGRRFAAFSSFLSLYAGNLVYIILSGMFLSPLLSPYLGGDEFAYSTAVFLLVSLVTYFNFRIFSAVESVMVVLLLLLIVAIAWRSFPYIDPQNYMTSDIHQFFLPFGAILFSLGASSAVPAMIHTISERQERIAKAITWGTVSYTAIYVVFIAAILGVTGAATSQESFSGLSLFIGDGVITAGYLLGFLAVITSYLTSNVALLEIFRYDYKLEKNLSWLAASLLPFIFFLIGYRDFIWIITFAGSITGGLIGILVILIFYHAKEKGEKKPAYEIHVSREISFLMVVVYLLGIFYEIIYDL